MNTWIQLISASHRGHVDIVRTSSILVARLVSNGAVATVHLVTTDGIREVIDDPALRGMLADPEGFLSIADAGGQIWVRWDAVRTIGMIGQNVKISLSNGGEVTFACADPAPLLSSLGVG